MGAKRAISNPDLAGPFGRSGITLTCAKAIADKKMPRAAVVRAALRRKMVCDVKSASEKNLVYRPSVGSSSRV